MRRASAMFPISVLGLVVWAVGTPGCESGAALKRDGGTDGTAVVMNCGDMSQPIDPTALIDDMETPDFMTARSGGRTGAWWAGGDPSSPGAAIVPMGDVAAEMIPGGRCGSKYAMHETGQGFTVWAALSVSMGWGSQDGGAEGLLPNDNSFRTGVTFWARIGDTSSDQVRFAISDKYSRPEGGICVDGGAMDVACYDTFGVGLTQLSTDWKQYRIPFGGLTQRNFGLPEPKLDPSSIYTIEFQFNPVTPFDFWVDDISFY
jgi:hypothetical protein